MQATCTHTRVQSYVQKLMGDSFLTRENTDRSKTSLTRFQPETYQKSSVIRDRTYLKNFNLDLQGRTEAQINGTQRLCYFSSGGHTYGRAQQQPNQTYITPFGCQNGLSKVLPRYKYRPQYTAVPSTMPKICLWIGLMQPQPLSQVAKRTSHAQEQKATIILYTQEGS